MTYIIDCGLLLILVIIDIAMIYFNERKKSIGVLYLFMVCVVMSLNVLIISGILRKAIINIWWCGEIMIEILWGVVVHYRCPDDHSYVKKVMKHIKKGNTLYSTRKVE